ncbi:Disease resistance-like protein DSC1 [Citrus sinensis]|nr:Disease resistance-like protein DSC1 [Citrus sinensis]
MASSSSSSCIYEVFLNFRGEDTRAIFTCHLYVALFKRKKIRTFVDDEELRRGDEISPALLNAIQGSKISVVVFSKDYASSKWCLNELVKILDCKNMKGQIIIPVFYGVSPSDVRHQTGIFGLGFGKLEQQFKEQPEMVRKWRDALTESSHLAGHESTKFRSLSFLIHHFSVSVLTRFDSIAFAFLHLYIRDNAQLLDKIVEDVLKKLEKLTVSTDSSNGLVGLNSRIEQIKPFLCMDSSDTVQIVGIWGMGGIGKTTLATAIFDQFSSEFEGRCFFSDVRRNSETGVGLEHLQKQMLSTILSEKLELAGPNIPQFTKERVRRMKVLIVLDDVNKVGQLEGLIGGLDQYGPGSRIVVTTRDKRVLEKFGVEKEKIYGVNGLEFEEAFELFCNFAFKENHCPKDLIWYSQRVVEYADGNPLVLKVLGSSLCLKRKSHWGKVLHDLNRICESDIHDIYKKLKISFDELTPRVQSIFLDIACFFEGEDKDFVARILDDSESDGLDVLIDKSLISISGDFLQMHDILQEMGRQIVRQESEKEPGKRSRLWDPKEIRRVLKHKKLEDSKLQLPDGLNYLPKKLRYLHWDKCPLRALPSNFKPTNLVELNLCFSKVEQLWEGKKEAFKLKSVDLCNSQNLTRMPDLSETPNLERKYLLNCTNLPFISSSIENLNNLSMLRLEGCKNLRTFTRIHFTCSVTIDFTSCINLAEFPKISGNIKVLKLARTWIEEVPSSIKSLINLEVLDLAHCKRLNRLSASICKLKSLSWLRLYNCSKLESFPGILEDMARLEYIDLRLTAIKELPSSVEHLEGLKELRMEYCHKLGKLPDNLGSLRSLKHLHAGKSAISQLPSSIADLKQVEELSFYGCRGLVLTSVLSDLSGNNFESLPASIKQLSQLRWLYLRNCNRLKSLPELPFGLCFLDARNCKQLQSLPEIPSCLEELGEIDTSILEILSNHSRIYFNFINCLKLNDKANKKILADSKLRIQRMAIASLRLSMYVKEYREPPVIKICLPGNEIPDWFSHQCLGSSLTIQLPHHSCNGSFIGFAFCIVIELEKDHKARDRIYYHFEIKTPSGTKTDLPSVFEQSFHSDQVILGFFPCWNIGLLDNDGNISLQFSVQYPCSEKSPKVHSCGVCPVYAHPNGTKPNTFTVNVLPPNEEECTQIRSGEPEVESICGEQINAPQQQRSSLFSHRIAKGGGLYAFLAPSDHASIQIQRRHMRLKVIFEAVGGIMKLNNQNYNTLSTCIESYLQGQDLWEVGGASEATQPTAKDANGFLQKWKIKSSKAMFALKTTIEEEMLEHVQDAKTPKEAWDTLVTFYSKKNDTRLQLLKNRLPSIAQCDMRIAQYFHKVKSIRCKISKLDPTTALGDARKKRIIIHGLRPQYRGFVATVQ